MTHSIQLRLDLDGLLGKSGGLEESELASLSQALLAARDRICDQDLKWTEDPSGAPEEALPVDGGFFTLPEQLLQDYQQRSDREDSELAAILSTAHRLRETADRIVLLGIGGSYMGARALQEALCPPYFNELSRAERGGAPRVYYEGNNVDNDAMRGLLGLLQGGSQTNRETDWAIVVISKSGGTLETAVAFRLFLQALRERYAGSPEELASRVVPVTGADGKLYELAEALGCPDVHRVPDGVGGRFSVLSAVGLLPAAVLGIDIEQLLEGARDINRHFRDVAEPGDNLVLRLAAACHAMEKNHGATVRVMSVWSKALEAVGFWYDQLLAESLGKSTSAGATPVTAVNTRDLHSRAQQHQEGRMDKLHLQLVLDEWRTDPLDVGKRNENQDQLNRFADKTVPDLMRAAFQGTCEAYDEAGRPYVNLHLEKMGPRAIGQLLQLLMLVTVVEGRLLGVNPYGQPGVQAYKSNMERILSGRS